MQGLLEIEMELMGVVTMSLRCSWDIHSEMLSRKLDISDQNSELSVKDSSKQMAS